MRKILSGSKVKNKTMNSSMFLFYRLNLNSEDISIQPVHPSIMGQVG